MIDLILLAAEDGSGENLRPAFQAARRAADAMLGLRVLAVICPGEAEGLVRSFSFNKAMVSPGVSLSGAIAAGARAARSGASRCFLDCARPCPSGEELTAFLRGYILSGRSLGRMGEEGPMVFSPTLLPSLLALRGEEDGSALFWGREDRSFFFSQP